MSIGIVSNQIRHKDFTNTKIGLKQPKPWVGTNNQKNIKGHYGTTNEQIHHPPPTFLDVFFGKYRGTTDRKVGTEQRGCTVNTRQLSFIGAAAAAAADDDDDDMERMCVSRLLAVYVCIYIYIHTLCIYFCWLS